MKRTILHLGGAAYHVPSLQALRKVGFRVACLDRDPNAPGLHVADLGIPGSVADPVDVYEAVVESGAAAIVTGLEIGVIPAALTSAALRGDGIGVDTALRCTDKILMRAAWDVAGLAQPQWVGIRAPHELRRTIETFGLPLVLKPARGNGSRGVSVVQCVEEVDAAIDEATLATNGHGFIIERFIAGPLITNDGFVDGAGRARIAVIGDVVTQSLSRHRVNTALNYPAALRDSDRVAVVELVERAAVALGLRCSPFHCEVILGSDGPILVELAARGGGSYIFSTIVAAVSGLDAPVVAARLALGEDVSIEPRVVGAASLTFLTAPPGIVAHIGGTDTARGLPGIVDFGVSLRPGDRGGAVHFDNARHGHIVALGATRDEAVARARAAATAVVFTMSDPPA